MGKNKIGPLGTPLGNPLKYFNDQKQAALVKAEGGRSIMNHEIAAEAARLKELQPLPPVGPPPSPTGYGNTTPGDLRHLDKYPVGPANPIDPSKIRARARRSGIRG